MSSSGDVLTTPGTFIDEPSSDVAGMQERQHCGPLRRLRL